MRSILKRDNLVIAAYLAVFAALIVLFPDTLHANPFEKIVGKFENVKDTVFGVAKILAVIGIIVGGIKKVLGHPDSWTWLWSSGLGAFIIFSADAIVTWLAE
ncbi:MAG TPA: TrbC/VirB2 family protein [bacterium]|nr:TrbC/VirB2 family protein [bacterium]